LLVAKAWVPLALIFALGCTLRLLDFNHYWLNPDEGIYFSMVSWNEWSSFWNEYLGNAHPPLFYLLIRAMSGLADGIAPLRCVALVAGCCCVPVTFLFVRECVSRDAIGTLAGLLAAALMAISQTAVEMSQIVRPYTLQIFAMTLGLFYLVRFMRRGGRRSLPLYAVWMTVALLTHYGTVLTLAGVALTFFGLLAFRRLDGKQARSIVVWNLPLLAVLLALYFLHIRPYLEGSAMAKDAMSGWLKELLIHDATQIWPRFLDVLSTFGPRTEGPAAIAFLVGLVVAARRKNVTVVLLALAVPAVAVAASFAHKYPMSGTRHSLYLVTLVVSPIALALAYGLLGGALSRIVTVALSIGIACYPTEVALLLGSELPVRPRENSVPLADFDKTRPALRAISKTPGVIVIPLQAFFLLTQEFNQERQTATWAKDEPFRRFRWGERDVLVVQQWEISLGFDALDTGKHLYDFVRSVDRAMPEIRLSNRRDVVFICGGWTSEMGSLKAFRTPSGRGLISGLYESKSVSFARFDLAAYSKAIAADLRSRRR
jgi:hypothetical protein